MNWLAYVSFQSVQFCRFKVTYFVESDVRGVPKGYKGIYVLKIAEIGLS